MEDRNFPDVLQCAHTRSPHPAALGRERKGVGGGSHCGSEVVNLSDRGKGGVLAYYG